MNTYLFIVSLKPQDVTFTMFDYSLYTCFFYIGKRSPGFEYIIFNIIKDFYFILLYI